MKSANIIKKLYSKEDIRLELGLSPHKFNKKMDVITRLYNIDMKKFHDYSGENINNQYTFNGVAKELVKVLLKGVDDYPIDINSKKFLDKGAERQTIIDSINNEQFMIYIRSIMKAIDDIRYNHLQIEIHSHKIYQETKLWLKIGNQMNQMQQEILALMDELSIYERINLQDEIVKAMDEVIFQFLANRKREKRILNDKLLEKYQYSIIHNQKIKSDYELDYKIYRLNKPTTDTFYRENDNFKESDHTSIDWLIAEMLKKSQRAKKGSTETLKSQTTFRRNIKKKYNTAISALIDHKLIEKGLPISEIDFLERKIMFYSLKLSRRDSHMDPLIYKSKTKRMNKIPIIKKINTILFYKNNIHQEEELLQEFLMCKKSLENLSHTLKKYSLVPRYAYINREILDYALEDIHHIMHKLDWYLNSEEINKRFPHISMTVNSATEEIGKDYIALKRKVREQADLHDEYSNIIIPSLTEQLRKDLNTKRFQATYIESQNKEIKRKEELEESEESIETKLKLLKEQREKKRRTNQK